MLTQQHRTLWSNRKKKRKTFTQKPQYESCQMKCVALICLIYNIFFKNIVGASLEQTHIFALAHILRRPIIVYGVKYVKSFRGETLGFANFQGRCCCSIDIMEIVNSFVFLLCWGQLLMCLFAASAFIASL